MVNLAKYILGLLATVLLAGVVVTGIPVSDFVSFPNEGFTSSSTPASLTLATAVSLPILSDSFTVVEGLQSGRLRFEMSGDSYEILNLGFLSSEFDMPLAIGRTTDATELAEASNLVQRVFPDDSPASFTPTVGVSLTGTSISSMATGDGPHTIQTVFVSDGTLSFLLFLQADGLIGSVSNNLLLQVEVLSSGESLGSGTTLFSHPNSGAGLDDVELQSNGCIPGLYALRLDSASLAQTATEPVTRLIPELSLRQFENIPNIMVCVRSCGSAGIIDNDIRVDYETADGTASAARDYRRSRGNLVFNIGDTSMCARFTIRDDTDDELNENFFIDWTNLDFSNADDREYQLSRARTTVTIRDNDLPRRRPRYCWICTRRQWMRNRRLCLYSIRIICGYTFPVTNTG